ncbi:MAG: hypothetical protein LBL07_02630 [Tannerella sp.]|nr:hypothetical protein [Tannerella sp.]
MKKKMIGFLAVTVITVVAAVNVNLGMQKNTLSSVTLENVEALAQENNTYCHSGGPGSSQCSISGGITILGVGTTTGCSVTCSSGYACCTLRCTCITN